MATTNVRELKARTSAILRRVREEGVAYDVTHRGKLVARLVPAREEQPNLLDWKGLWSGLLTSEQVDQLDRAVDEVKAEVEEQLERMLREIGEELESPAPSEDPDAR